MTALPGETYIRAYPTIDEENPAWVSYGRPHEELCAHRVRNTFDAKRVYIVASRSLLTQTDEVQKLVTALGDRYVGTFPGFAPHTPLHEVVEATNDAREKSADCIVTIGGGSLIDGAKAMLLYLANDISSPEQVPEFTDSLMDVMKEVGVHSSKISKKSPTIPLITIVTTLSGGEFSSFAGVTDVKTHHKMLVGHPFAGPKLIINDPKLTVTTPEWVWLSTGVRAIDHCTESFCRLIVDDDEVDAGAIEGLKLVVPNLLITQKDWTNQEARLKSMLGVRAVVIMSKKKILPGASHGIGHQLGPLGVGHGETSCILLPAVMKYNARVNKHKQDKLKDILWGDAAVAEVLRKRGLDQDTSDAGDVLDAIFRELGMPRTLKEKGIGRDKFDMLAGNSLKDRCLATNPIPIDKKEQVLEILEMCAGD